MVPVIVVGCDGERAQPSPLSEVRLSEVCLWWGDVVWVMRHGSCAERCVVVLMVLVRGVRAWLVGALAGSRRP